MHQRVSYSKCCADVNDPFQYPFHLEKAIPVTFQRWQKALGKGYSNLYFKHICPKLQSKTHNQNVKQPHIGMAKYLGVCISLPCPSSPFLVAEYTTHPKLRLQSY